MKKIIALILSGLMLFNTISVMADSFNDIAGHWGEKEINQALEKGIVNGDGTGAFRPNDTVTRAEFIKMLSAVVVKYMGAQDVPDNYKTENNWYSKYYNFATSMFLMQDNENAVDGINPGVLADADALIPITRWEMAYSVGSVLNILLGKTSNTIPIFMDSNEIQTLPGSIPTGIALSAENNVMKGTGGGKFSPFGTGSRAEAAAISLRVDTLITDYITAENEKQDAAMQEAQKQYEDNRITYSDSEIPTSNVKVKFTMNDGKTFTVELYPKEAPQTVANFVSLVNKGFYNGLKFHRVIDGFVAQGGDPKGDGSGDSGKFIYGEFAENGFEGNTLKHTTGTISMARTGVSNNSASSGFFICYADQPSLDGAYAAFGQVIEGMETVNSFLEIEREMSIIGELSVPKEDIIIKSAVIVK